MTESKVETTSSIGAAAQKRQSLQEFWDNHDDILHGKLISACEEADLPDAIQDEIVQKGMARFVLDKDKNIKPVGSIKTVQELIAKCKKDDKAILKDIRDYADERAIEKKRLHELMVHYANEGDSKNYRQVRQEYAQL